MSTFLYTLLNEVRDQGNATDMSKQLSRVVTEWVYTELCNKFYEFELCSDNWKAKKFLTLKYAQWKKTHFLSSGNGSTVKRESSSKSYPFIICRTKILLKLQVTRYLNFPNWIPSTKTMFPLLISMKKPPQITNHR
jgi:hypothetical protein